MKSKSKDVDQTAVAERDTSVSITIEFANRARDIAEGVAKSLKDHGVENVTVRQSRADKKPVIPASEFAIVPGTGCMSQEKPKKKKKTADELFEKLGFKKVYEEDERVKYERGNNEIAIKKCEEEYCFASCAGGIAHRVTGKEIKAVRRKAKEKGWR